MVGTVDLIQIKPNQVLTISFFCDLTEMLVLTDRSSKADTVFNYCPQTLHYLHEINLQPMKKLLLGQTTTTTTKRNQLCHKALTQNRQS